MFMLLVYNAYSSATHIVEVYMIANYYTSITEVRQ